MVNLFTTPGRNSNCPLYKEAARRWESRLKIDVPEFDGSLEANDYLDRIQAVKELLDYKEVPDDHRVALVITRKFRTTIASPLSSHGCVVVHHPGGSRPRRLFNGFVNHESLSEPSFANTWIEQVLYQKLLSLRQNNCSVHEYTKDFYDYLSRIDLCDSESQIVAHYISGLKSELQDGLSMFMVISSLSKAHQRTMLLEQQIARHFSCPSLSANSSSATLPGRPPSPPAQHTPGGDTPSVNMRCFNCGEVGHRRSSCHKLRSIRALLAENTGVGEYKGTPMFGVDLSEALPEEHVLEDKGACLVSRRSCLAPKDANVNEVQRNHIFESTCTIGRKVCHFIVDSGSCENVIAVNAVAKLNLATEPHPSPYALMWIQSGSSVTVDRRVMINFSIGAKYRDSMWCDVVPMDACHLLLGRPWQFDRSVMHDGRLNTYSFLFDGAKIVLHSSSPRGSSIEGCILLLSHSEFELELPSAPFVVLLLGLARSESSESIPPSVSVLLKEFQDVFPTELPSDLPPL